MLDKWTTPLIQPTLKLTALWLKRHGIKPNQVTITGFLIGMIALPLLACEYYSLALLLILGNRIMDGLDGALARLASPSDAGGFLDITLDFIFYSGIVLGFALASPAKNAVAACVLIFSFMGTGASFLAYAIMAEKHQLPDPNFKHKSLYYLGGAGRRNRDHFPLYSFLFAARLFSTTCPGVCRHLHVNCGSQSLVRLPQY